MAARQKSRSQGGRGWLGALSGMVLLLSAVAAPIIVYSSAMLLVVPGLLPAMAAAISDREPGRPLLLCIAPLNGLGALFVALHYWDSARALSAALAALAGGMPLLIMYSAAAAGWALYLAMPAAAQVYLAHADETRRAEVKRDMDALKEEWGDEVAGPD